MAVLNRSIGQAQRRAQTTPLRIGPVLAVAVIAIVVLAVLQLTETSGATTTNFAIHRLEEQKLELRTVTRQLEAEVATLSSLSRVEREARERLGLEPPRSRETIEVNASWPAQDQPRLPTRFAPDAVADESGESSTWWRDLLQLLPFY